VTGAEMRAIRDELGLSAVQLGRAFGYAGGDATVATMISKYEREMRPIPVYLQRLLLMYRRHGVPAGWTSKLHSVIAVHQIGDDE
jgi:hypothetical protein